MLRQNIKEGIEGHAVDWYSDVFNIVFPDVDPKEINEKWKEELKPEKETEKWKRKLEKKDRKRKIKEEDDEDEDDDDDD